MSRVFCLCFPLSFIVSSLPFRSLIHFEFIFVYGVRDKECWNFIFFTCSYPVFPVLLIKQTFFSPLYILASSIINQVTIGVWVYLWTFYPVPLIYMSVFVPVSYCFDCCSSVVCKFLFLEEYFNLVGMNLQLRWNVGPDAGSSLWRTNNVIYRSNLRDRAVCASWRGLGCPWRRSGQGPSGLLSLSSDW